MAWHVLCFAHRSPGFIPLQPHGSHTQALLGECPEYQARSDLPVLQVCSQKEKLRAGWSRATTTTSWILPGTLQESLDLPKPENEK